LKLEADAANENGESLEAANQARVLAMNSSNPRYAII
jgi:hypothetical protein